MGLTVAATVDIGRPLFAGAYDIGSIVALVRANIDRSLLDGWLELPKLMAQYPNQIHLQGTAVAFDGPVAIIKSVTALKTSLIALIAIATALLTYYATTLLLNALNSCHLIDNWSEDSIFTISLVAAGIMGVGVGGLIYAFDALPLTITPGVYFLT
ncbi:MAG: hypothetical protein HYX48_01815 [Chlamydiales bacterium]|nr:hypothetical protein [Chlamydiales bacterium]